MLKFAGIQLSVQADKKVNLSNAKTKIGIAAGKGAKIVCLPECFNCPYGNSYFPEYAEEIPGPSSEMLKAAAISNSIYLIGGSIPERVGDKLYNTSLIYGPKGDLLGKHRKIHLFDIDIPGKMTFQESKTLTPGSSVTSFPVEGFGSVGVAICYDIRFPELAMVAAKQGVRMICYPGAFNMTTGPAHWELLQRSRALDNQIYVAAVSPARDEKASYTAWGHSTVVSPWGEVISTTEHQEDIIYADIDPSYIDQVREQIPVSKQKRYDIYTVELKGN
mmetsp:Transcript_28063/g.31199  ORF Transcript_28063/g.31199 Transcript_28063/m.31199 type:complete len:276 (+) Transcript_28063:23-850(+)